jgi:Microtubule-binding stalk of dynein motor
MSRWSLLKLCSLAFCNAVEEERCLTHSVRVSHRPPGAEGLPELLFCKHWVQCLQLAGAAVQDFVSNPNFNADYIRSKSGAAAGLCGWVVNICKYFRIYQVRARTCTAV